MNTARKLPTRRTMKNNQIIVFTHGQKTRRGYAYKSYKCRVVMFDGVPYLRAEAGRVWFVPKVEGDGFTYKRLVSPRHDNAIIELERSLSTMRHREWRKRTHYQYTPR